MTLDSVTRDFSGKDVALIITPPVFTRMPMVGLAYLATYLKQQGCSVALLDLSVLLFNQGSDELRKLWSPECTNACFVTEIAEKIYSAYDAQLRVFVDQVVASDVRVVAFSVNQVSIFLANRLAEDIKRRDRNRTIVFGGPGTYFKHPRELTTPGFVDYYVIGEGEEVLLSLVRRLKKGVPVGRERGLLLRKDFGVVMPEPAPLVEDLNRLPFPTYEEFDLAAYNDGSDYKPLPLLLSRGCIKKCSYCIDHIMWPKYRVRSARHAFNEIEYHCRVNKTKAFELNDLLCNGNLRELEALCDLIIAAGLKFDWVSYGVIRADMTPRLCVKMKQAGCHTIIYGMEHSSLRILKGMNKGYTSAEAEKVIRMTHAAGICTNVNVIVAFPGETMADLDEVAVFLKRNRDHISEVTNISGFTLFPASTIGQHQWRYGISLKENTDPMLFKDANGLDRQGRMDRVAYFSKIVDDLGLRQNIINRPKLNPEVKEREG